MIVQIMELEHGIGAEVTYDAKIPMEEGERPRQIDVLVETEQAGRRFRRIVEVQNRSRSIDQKFIDEALGKTQAVKAHRATLVATAGFTKSARLRIERMSDQLDGVELKKGREGERPHCIRNTRLRFEGKLLDCAHSRYVNAVSGDLIADLLYAPLARGVIALIVPAGGDANSITTWMLGAGRPFGEPIHVVMKHHDTETGVAGEIVSPAILPNLMPDGQPVRRGKAME